MNFSEQAEFAAQLTGSSQYWSRLRALAPDLDEELVQMVVGAAADFAENRLAPLNAIGDREGCRIDAGRVLVPEAYHAVWNEMAEGGWIGIDAPEASGGQGLPLAVQAGAEMLFDRAAMAFCMLPGSTRCAVFVLDEYADEAVKAEWASELCAGTRSATICISEADAGSDLGRMRTRATKDSEGRWRVSGQKCWISFGGHDLTSQVGHMVLARSTDAPGTRGVSLFLVPAGSDEAKSNGVRVERIEEKLGLHGSPTCVLNFENAEAHLIGEEGRGLPQLFTMIERMRLLTAGQGAGVAMAAYDAAVHYAQERKQGGPADSAPVSIDQHADVQRQLAEMGGRAMCAQALVLELAMVLDLAHRETDDSARSDAAALAAFLLPIAKNFGGETGFEVASRAIQVFGGAGYTQEWPVEQYLRDTRILTIFEGTTGMQALDLLHRRHWKDDGRGVSLLARAVRADIERATDAQAAETVEGVLAEFETLAAELLHAKGDGNAEYGAEPFLRAAWAVVSAWMGLRIAGLGHADPRVAASGRLRIEDAAIELTAAVAQSKRPSEWMRTFGAH